MLAEAARSAGAYVRPDRTAAKAHSSAGTASAEAHSMVLPMQKTPRRVMPARRRGAFERPRGACA
jgi:hypothetical protein